MTGRVAQAAARECSLQQRPLSLRMWMAGRGLEERLLPRWGAGGPSAIAVTPTAGVLIISIRAPGGPLRYERVSAQTRWDLRW